MREGHIQRLSRVLKWVFIAAAALLPLFNVGYWMTDGYPFLLPWGIDLHLIPNFHSFLVKPITELTGNTKFMAFCVTLIPTSINVCACLLLARLFNAFERLELFSGSNIVVLRKIGGCVLFNQITYPLYMGILSVTLTYANPPGERLLSIGFGLEQLYLLVVGSVIILISWIMEKGKKLEEEQASVI